MTAFLLTLRLSNSTEQYLYDPMQKRCSPVTLVPQLEVLTSMRPVEGGGVAVGHPGEALAAQHRLDGALPCLGGLTLQG